MHKLIFIALVLGTSSASAQSIVRDLDTKAGQCAAYLDASNDFRRLRAYGLMSDKAKFTTARDEFKLLIQTDPTSAESSGQRACKAIKVI